MSVYVDDAFIPASVPHRGRAVTSRWCHLIADTEDELHAFAAGIGLARAWYQQPKGVLGGPPIPSSLKAQFWHYDVTASRRAAAVRAGAIEVTRRQLLEIIKARHATLYPPGGPTPQA